MIKTKTLLQIIEEGYTYPEMIPESLQGTINDWFEMRHVVDDDNFARYFNRILNRDYHRYNELLRIEAGIGTLPTAYDWLVNSYLEKESITDNALQKNGSSQTTGAENMTETFTPGVIKTVKTDGEDKYGKTETSTNNLTSVNSGQDSTTNTYGRIDTNVGEAHENTGVSNDSNTTSTSKMAPASVLVSSYDRGTNGDAEDTGDSNVISTELGEMDTWDEELKSPTSISQGVSHGLTKTGSAKNDRVTNTASGSDTASTNYGHSVTNTGGGSVVLGGKDEKSVTMQESYEGKNENYKSGNNVTETIDNGSEYGNSTTREVYTGRSGETPASALEKAKAYIQTTSAWEWFRQQLEPCFMAVYDI